MINAIMGELEKANWEKKKKKEWSGTSETWCSVCGRMVCFFPKEKALEEKNPTTGFKYGRNVSKL